MKRLPRVTLLAVLLVATASCRRSGSALRKAPERTCVVLSVGSARGLAHLGALDALVERGVPIDCVVGNSMGALVGSLYASAPEDDLRTRYRAFLHEYERETVHEAKKRGAVGAAVGMLAVLLSGGALGPALAAGALGAAGGASSVPELSHERFAKSLDVFLRSARIEDLPVPFATFYQEPTDEGLQRVAATQGPLAEAVASSAANPFLFEDASLQRIDPGADRVSAVPVHDACTLFPRSRLIAINVTGEPAFYRPDLDCEVHEIRVPLGATSVEAFRGTGEAFEATWQAGHDAVLRALDDGGI
ncbi:patatin-like phospholipase family protein [Pyxidicoccus parkwayensis]|uniref:Patatin-like phospholipase family protein n=1 Tax=Pyxidicoccus parkwayensis TaxID=2813578 RepID=A0ABX7P5U2_9BACT|nr:patatin-like phospholipase family protein [Pyxidicoccus parkwaysis]QSQ25801.1 patatin-like phospholipase family protein [Pyxidicoccus parkwaysis]